MALKLQDILKWIRDKIDYRDGYPKLLWSGSGCDMNANKTVTLSSPVSSCPSGIVLVWSYYDTSKVVHDYDYHFYFIPKSFHDGNGVDCLMTSAVFNSIADKYVYIHDSKITGNANNTKAGTGASGIKYDNDRWVLREVWGV